MIEQISDVLDSVFPKKNLNKNGDKKKPDETAKNTQDDKQYLLKSLRTFRSKQNYDESDNDNFNDDNFDDD